MNACRCGRVFSTVRGLATHCGTIHGVVPADIEGIRFKRNYENPNALKGLPKRQCRSCEDFKRPHLFYGTSNLCKQCAKDYQHNAYWKGRDEARV